MAMTPDCGIRNNAEGAVTREDHCPCPECACPQAAAGTTKVKTLGRPMCSRWYERAGDHRPWDPPQAPDPVHDAEYRAVMAWHDEQMRGCRP